MKTVNIGTLKNQLSSYLRYVRDGEEIIVQDRKKPCGRSSSRLETGNQTEHELRDGEWAKPSS